MDRRLLASLGLASCLVASVCTSGAVAARPPKAASVDIAYTMTGGHCYASMTVTWSGYQVNRIRYIGYVEGRPEDLPAWLDTKSYPQGESHSSGTMTSTPTVAARPGEGWYVFAILRSNGGARLAEIWSPVVYAPAECLYP